MYINNCACNFDKLYGLSICYLLIIRYTLALHYVLLIEKDPKNRSELQSMSDKVPKHKFGKIHYLFGVNFPNLISQLLPIITPLILHQLT